MGIYTHDPFDRSALLVCDACDRYLMADNRLSTEKRSESDPEVLAPHFRYRDELAAPATSIGWQATITSTAKQAHWLCPMCAKRGAGGPAP